MFSIPSEVLKIEPIEKNEDFVLVFFTQVALLRVPILLWC